MKANDSDGVKKIHNVRFYNLTPRSINCLAYNKVNGKLAVSRNDASLEIWDIRHAPLLEKTIPGNVNLSIEVLGWVGDRLFSAGLTSEIIEWDLGCLEKKHTQSVTGNAVWCLDVSRQQDCIAFGTEEGYLNLFEITEAKLMYKLLFDKQDGRILCCKFDASGDYIVTGSTDAIRIWSTKSGNAIHKMTMGRSEAKRETLVWSLQVLNDFTIISGDSRGYITIWDGKIATQVQSICATKIDILAVVVNEKENIIAAAGVDSIIRIYTLTNVKKEEQSMKMWVKFLQRAVHDHDVKALACAGTRIISGGIDGYLGVSSYSKIKLECNKYGPFLQPPCANVSSEGRLLLLRYTNYLELWRLGIAENRAQINDDESDPTRMLLLEEGPEKLIELRSYKDETIVCSAISPNGHILVYSTLNTIRVFSLLRCSGREACKLIRIKDIPEQLSPCHRIIFSSDSETMFLVKLKRRIDIFKILSTGEIDYQETIDASKSIKDVIHLVTISPCGKYLIVAGTCRIISVWMKSENDGWEHQLNLPKYVAPTTSIAVHYGKPCLVATFSDGKIFEYDLEEMKFTCSSRLTFIPEMNTHCVNGIILDPKNENAFILHNDNSLFVLLKDEENIRTKVAKSDENTKNSVAKLKFKFTKTYEHFVHLDWLSEQELVVVGINPVTLIEQLPAAFRRKKFGAS